MRGRPFSLLSEEGSSECLFLFSLCGAAEASRSGLWLSGATRPRTPGAAEASRFGLQLPGLPGPDPGDFLYAQKVTKKAPGRPWTPFFAQSVRIGGETQLPLKFQLSFVIGAVRHALRLSALESMAVSWYATIDTSLPLTGRQPKPDAQPGGDQMPKKGISVAAQQQI